MKNACALMLGSAPRRLLKYITNIDADLEYGATGCLARKIGTGTPGAAGACKMLKSKFNTVSKVVSGFVVWFPVAGKVVKNLSNSVMNRRQRMLGIIKFARVWHEATSAVTH